MTIASPMTLALPVLLLLFNASTGSAQGPYASEAGSDTLTTSFAAPTAGRFGRHPGATTTGFIPSRTLGVTAKLSSGGVGLDLTVPFAPRFALRAGASFLSVDGSLVVKNINIDGNLKLQNAFAGVDFFPFHNSFRITPGFSFANRTTASANLSIPGGQSFSFGNGNTNTSDPADPVNGNAAFVFGHNFSPRLTLGWANAIPHRNQHFSFPFEIGAEYIPPPTVRLAVGGSACQVEAGTTFLDCGPVDQADIVEEQRELVEDVKPLRVFPVISLGVTYWFGHVRSRN